MTESIIDVNVTLGRWPFRRVFGDEPRELVDVLRERGVAQAWTASIDGLFHRDLAGANARLADDCRRFGEGRLIAFGSINPMLPDWRDDLRRCRDDHKMPGVRLHPNYHGYRLDHPEFAEALAAIHDAELIAQLTMSMEDERTQHPVFRVPRVDPAPLPVLLKRWPKLRLTLLNAFPGVNLAQAASLAQTSASTFEIATLEGIGGVGNLVEAVGTDRVLFGSHAPLFYWESSRLKVQEAGLKPDAVRAILEGNARTLMASPIRPEKS